MRGYLLPIDRFQITIRQIPDKYNNYNYVRGQFTTFWQIPDKKNNYNYVRGQFTTFWQIPDKKIITIMWEGNLLPFDRFQTKKKQLLQYYLLTERAIIRAIYYFWQIPDKKKLQLCERAIYYLLTDSRKKNYNYARKLLIDRFQTNIIIIIMWEGNLLHFDRFQTKKIITIMREGNLLPFDRFQTKK